MFPFCSCPRLKEDARCALGVFAFRNTAALWAQQSNAPGRRVLQRKAGSSQCNFGQTNFAAAAGTADIERDRGAIVRCPPLAPKRCWHCEIHEGGDECRKSCLRSLSALPEHFGKNEPIHDFGRTNFAAAIGAACIERAPQRDSALAVAGLPVSRRRDPLQDLVRGGSDPLALPAWATVFRRGSLPAPRRASAAARQAA